MKGIVFTEFLEMVESKFGLETVDKIIERAELKTGGAYTSIGTYEFNEMLQLILNLSNEVNIPVDDLIHAFGIHFFEHLEKTHPNIFELYKNPMDFLNSVEGHIHVQVRKIYPGAELPTFEVTHRSSNSMEMIYTSQRALYKFAEALMLKTFEHFHTECTITYEKLNSEGTRVKFNIIHND